MRTAERQKLTKSIIDISRQLQKAQSRWTQALKGIDLLAIADGMKRFEAHFGDQLSVLAQHGWYISWWYTPLAWIYPLAALFREGRIKEGDRKLCDHFAECLPKIEAHLVDTFPARATILTKAFEAHRRGEYELSIPAFLSQADGMGNDVLGTSVYSRRPKSIESVRNYIDGVASQRIERDMLEVVLLLTPLNASERDMSLFREAFNRHEILHGINTSYATDRNSFRAISWLQYVASFCGR